MKKYKDFSVTVFGLSVPIYFIPRVFDRHGVEAAGMFHRREIDGDYEILIGTEVNTSHQDITSVIIHELVHCCIYRLGLHNTTLEHNVEEVIADGIATMMVEIWNFDI